MSSESKRKMSRRELISGTAAVAGVALASQLGTPPGRGGERQSRRRPSRPTRMPTSTMPRESSRPTRPRRPTSTCSGGSAIRFPRRLRKDMWVLDFHLGDFAHVGMAGIFWLNRQDYGYFGHEIYLLPGQMIPEHQHLATDKGPAKMESWQPRHGMIYTFGEGEPTPEFLAKIPASQRDIVKSRHCKPLAIDEVGDLNRREAWHFMVAGPESALGDRIRHLSRHGGAEVLQPQGETVVSSCPGNKKLGYCPVSLRDRSGKRTITASRDCPMNTCHRIPRFAIPLLAMLALALAACPAVLAGGYLGPDAHGGAGRQDALYRPGRRPATRLVRRGRRQGRGDHRPAGRADGAGAQPRRHAALRHLRRGQEHGRGDRYGRRARSSIRFPPAIPPTAWPSRPTASGCMSAIVSTTMSR